MSTKYAFQDSTPPPSAHRKHRRGGRGSKSGGVNRAWQEGNYQQSEDGASAAPTEEASCTGSLTYSASSSINSGSSATGESTDSSFADIMRVLDLDNDADLATLMMKEGLSASDPLSQAQAAHQLLLQKQRQQGSRRQMGGSGSVTSSLNYSEDGESSIGYDQAGHQTNTGQPSDSHGPDGGGLGNSDDILFAPAMPSEHRHRTNKHRGSKKKNENTQTQAFENYQKYDLEERSTTSSGSTPPTSPPPRTKKGNIANDKQAESKSEVWYSQWWMCGFADALKFDS